MLITKLRSANTAETRQYWKASKALLVLIPLFGLTYLIVIYGPQQGMERKIFDIARAFLLSTQVKFILYILMGALICAVHLTRNFLPRIKFYHLSHDVI